MGRRRSSLAVMVVHPSELVSMALFRGLEAKGYRVSPFGSAIEAWSVLETTRVSLLVIAEEDSEMGRLGLLKKLREDPRFEAMPVVVLASDPTNLEVFDAYHLGADIVLDAHDLGEVITVIDHLLNPP